MRTLGDKMSVCAIRASILQLDGGLWRWSVLYAGGVAFGSESCREAARNAAWRAVASIIRTRRLLAG